MAGSLGVDVFDHRGERAALSRTGHPTNENEPVGTVGDCVAVDLGQMKLFKVGNLATNVANGGVGLTRRAIHVDPISIARRTSRRKIECAVALKLRQSPLRDHVAEHFLDEGTVGKRRHVQFA